MRTDITAVKIDMTPKTKGLLYTTDPGDDRIVMSHDTQFRCRVKLASEPDKQWRSEHVIDDTIDGITLWLNKNFDVVISASTYDSIITAFKAQPRRLDVTWKIAPDLDPAYYIDPIDPKDGCDGWCIFPATHTDAEVHVGYESLIEFSEHDNGDKVVRLVVWESRIPPLNARLAAIWEYPYDETFDMSTIKADCTEAGYPAPATLDT